MTPSDPIREMLFPPDRKPSNPKRAGTIVYNAYEFDMPLRYEVQHEAHRMNGRPIVDPGFCLFDIAWRVRVGYNKNERPIWLEMRTRNEAYRREMAMYDEKPTGLLAAYLVGLDAYNAVGGVAELLGQAQVAACQNLDTRALDVGTDFHREIDMAIKRHLRPLLGAFDADYREAGARLLAHARRKPKMWETPLGVAPKLGYRWRVEGDMLAVVALEAPPVSELRLDAYVTRRRPYKPYMGLDEAPAAAAERAAEIVAIMAQDSSEGAIRRGRLLREGAHWLDQPYAYADKGRTARDTRRMIEARIVRAAAFARIDMGEEMLREAIDYVLARSREREIPAAK